MKVVWAMNDGLGQRRGTLSKNARDNDLSLDFAFVSLSPSFLSPLLQSYATLSITNSFILSLSQKRNKKTRMTKKKRKTRKKKRLTLSP